MHQSLTGKNKKRPVFRLIFLLVGMTGLEPAASSSRTKRATGLRYIPLFQDGKNNVFMNCCQIFPPARPVGVQKTRGNTSAHIRSSLESNGSALPGCAPDNQLAVDRQRPFPHADHAHTHSC